LGGLEATERQAKPACACRELPFKLESRGVCICLGLKGRGDCARKLRRELQAASLRTVVPLHQKVHCSCCCCCADCTQPSAQCRVRACWTCTTQSPWRRCPTPAPSPSRTSCRWGSFIQGGGGRLLALGACSSTGQVCHAMRLTMMLGTPAAAPAVGRPLQPHAAHRPNTLALLCPAPHAPGPVPAPAAQGPSVPHHRRRGAPAAWLPPAQPPHVFSDPCFCYFPASCQLVLLLLLLPRPSGLAAHTRPASFSNQPLLSALSLSSLFWPRHTHPPTPSATLVHTCR